MILFGAHGQLGGAIKAACAESGGWNLEAVPWDQARTWAPEHDQAYFSSRTAAVVVFASGVTDQSLPRAAHMESNFDFPRRIMEAAAGLPGLRFITFGSALEGLHGPDCANAYFASKARLSEFMQSKGRGTHLRLHTLYGASRPHHHMFLGQIFECLRENRDFRMSSGRQFRQYHHSQDIARSVLRLAEMQVGAVLDLNGGETMQLRAVAEHVFSSFGKPHLLHIGALPDPLVEVTAPPTYINSPPALFSPRPTLPGIVEWLGDCLRRE